MRDVVRWGLFPGLLCGVLLAGWWLVRAGVPPGWAVAGLLGVSAAVLLVAQRALPYEARWKGRPKDYGLDLLHSGFTSLTGELVRAGWFGLLVWGTASAAGSVGLGLWPSGLPLVVELALALVIGDLGAYAVHRLAHSWGPLWRVHALHHTAERMYVLAAGRNHPFNVALTYTAQVGPLLLLGAGADTLVFVGLFTAVHGLLQHANVDFRHGWLNCVFATADLHRWHHHPDRNLAAHNYGSNLILWDWVFGTRYLPADAACHDAGIDVVVRENVFTHLATPFTLGRAAGTSRDHTRPT